jgi:PBP1b-binding outer membrane lipoprotein LpoB
MKKLIIILLSLTILFSCTKQEDKKQEILPLDNQIVSEKDTSTGSDLDKKQEIDTEVDETGIQNISPEERHKEELIKVTHNNFKQNIDILKKM